MAEIPKANPEPVTYGGPANLAWDEEGKNLKSNGIDSVLFWLKPSLVSVLQPLWEEIGEDLYSKLIAFEASKGTHEDYEIMMNVAGRDFVKGFLHWGEVVKSCGWGAFSVESFSEEKKEAVIRIDQPWELRCLRAKMLTNNIPFLCGKISGVFSHHFKTNCIAEVIETDKGGEQENTWARIHLKHSRITLERALLELHEARGSSSEGDLRALNNSLRRGQRRLLDVIETMGEFIWECDPSLVIHYATNQAGEVLGVEGKVAEVHSWHDFLSAADIACFEEMLAQLDSGLKFVEAEFQCVNKGASGQWVHLRAKRLLDFSGEQMGFVGSARDITREKILRDQLAEQQKNSEYAAKMATLGEMAGGIAHEVNTPLAVISLKVEGMLDDIAEGKLSAESCKNDLYLILSTTDRIAKIVTGLRAFARDGTRDPMTEVAVSALFSDVSILCQNRMGLRGVKLSFLAPSDDLKVRGRPTQISQVLLNLLNNAFDATADLPERWINIESKVEGKMVKITVEDSGPGIPPQVLEKLMQPFFTTKPVGKGTGLGLSISKGIIEAHGGKLYVDTSRPNTCFAIELPKA